MGMDYRVEKDTLGEVKVPADRLWGAQTQRSLENFRVGNDLMPTEIIRAFALIKKAAAITNAKLGVLESEKADRISVACNEIYAGKHDEEFPLTVWQTGSGTQTNMNLNEVIAHMTGLHPNDDVNRSQSTNDVFPSAIHVAAVILAENALVPAMESLRDTLAGLSEKYAGLIKTGRTHLQDATPLTLGQEISAWEEMLTESIARIASATDELRCLALGGTAVGTGIGAPSEFAPVAAEVLSSLAGIEFSTAPNKFHALSSKSALTSWHGALKTLATDLYKMASDVRLLASGPRAGIGEISIPANEPGSSIMPGKVNPTQCEMMTMVCARVIGSDVTMGFANSQGQLQLNVFMPVIAHTAIESAGLLADAIASFNANCIAGLKPNPETISNNLKNSLMLVTALSPRLGYDIAAEIAKYAYEHGVTLKESAVGRGLISEQEFDKLADPAKLV